jgi:hypothetical protein
MTVSRIDCYRFHPHGNELKIAPEICPCHDAA